jgi:beta-lactamase class A
MTDARGAKVGYDSLQMSRLPVIILPILLTTALICGCSGTSRTELQAVSPLQSAPSPAQSAPSDLSSVQREVQQIAALAKGRVGAAAVVLETGETIVSLSGQDHFPMQSVYKLPISMAVMKQVDAGEIKLDQKERIAKDVYVGRAAHSPIRDKYPNGTELSVDELIRFALVDSDGTASDILMKLAGGPQAVQAYLTELGIRDLIVLDSEKSMAENPGVQYRNYTSPEAAVALLRALHERRGLSESSHGVLTKYMIASTPGAKRLKGQLPAGTIVAHKTGTSGTEKGITAATNDIGIIALPNGQHIAIAVFVSDSPTDQVTREGVIARIARAVWDARPAK